MPERKLASLRTISELEPIENADKIELAHIDGWKAIVKKGDFVVGDPCVYFEVDAYLPVRAEFEFLRKNCFKSLPHIGDGFRIKTMKMKGVLSQGLILPLSDFSELKNTMGVLKDLLVEGADLTELLGVKKYEPPPSFFQGQCKGTFPNFIRKTDQERIQNISQRDFEKYMAGRMFETTLKLDGSSITIFKNNDEYGVCSRNQELKMDSETCHFVKAAKASGILEFLQSQSRNLAFQGELMGPGVQGNREKLDTHMIYIFDVWDIDMQCYLGPEERRNLCSTNNVQQAPLLEWGTFPVVSATLPYGLLRENMLRVVEDFSSINHPIAEGAVFKRIDGAYSFKVINNKFLLEEE